MHYETQRFKNQQKHSKYCNLKPKTMVNTIKSGFSHPTFLDIHPRIVV